MESVMMEGLSWYYLRLSESYHCLVMFGRRGQEFNLRQSETIVSEMFARRMVTARDVPLSRGRRIIRWTMTAATAAIFCCIVLRILSSPSHLILPTLILIGKQLKVSIKTLTAHSIQRRCEVPRHLQLANFHPPRSTQISIDKAAKHQ
jgi:hypothetical protein